MTNDPQAPQKILKLKGLVRDYHKEAGTNFKPEGIFAEGCRSCHADRGKGKSNEELFKAVCQVCHRQGKSAIALDIIWLQKQTGTAWQSAIAKGKNSMPAFASAHKGPLDSAQITGLIQYLKNLPKAETANPPKPVAGAAAPIK